MQAINITELRSQLPKYLSDVQEGTEILVTSHGEVIARLLPPLDTKLEAMKKLKLLKKTCHIGDVISAIDMPWNAEK